MATNQTAFNATVVAVQNNLVTFAPYLSNSTLSLQGQGITDADCLPLANALKNNTSVQTLFLYSNNAISDSGATTLADALQVNMALITLKLNYNSIGSSGAIALARALQVNTTLKELRLGGINPIGDTGIIALAQALQLNTALTILGLGSIFISDNGYFALASALQCNYVLTTLVRDTSSYDSQIDALLGRNIECAAATLQCPVLKFNPPIVPQNSVVAVNATHLQITNTVGNQILGGNFTVTRAVNGNFINAAQQTLSQFSQTAVNASQVFIQADNSGLPITCNITASFGNFSTCDIPITFNVTAAATASFFSSVPTTPIVPTPTIPLTSNSAPLAITTATFPTAVQASTESSSSGTSPAIISGAAVGGIALAGAATYLLYRRHKQQRLPIQSAQPTYDVATTTTHNPLFNIAGTVVTESEVGTSSTPWPAHYAMHQTPAAQPWDPRTYATAEQHPWPDHYETGARKK